jgi:uncharacterized coiled-coil DUF342 family protein
MSKRLEYIGLDQVDFDVLKSLHSWAHSIAPEIAHEFYDRQFAFGPTAKFLLDHAKKMGVPKDEFRRILEKSQARYFTEIFDEAEKGLFGGEYFEKRLKVGQTHNRLNLPVKWYLGAYMSYFDIFTKHLRAKYSMTPWLVEKAERAVLAVFNLDMQAIVDGFVLDLLESASMRIDRIQPSPDADLTEHIGDIRKSFENEISEIVSHLGNGNLNIEIEPISDKDVIRTMFQNNVNELRHMVGKLQDSSRLLYDAVQSATQANHSILQSVTSVSSGSEQQQEMADKAMREILEKVSGVSSLMRVLDSSSKEVGSVTQSIQSLALQTTMLALNAAIEASRAGSAGSGFAVVAGEVRKLAELSTQSSKTIARIVQTMQSNVEQVTAVIESSESDTMQTASEKSLIDSVRELQKKFPSMRSIADENLQSVNRLMEGAQQNQETTERLKDLAFEIHGISSRFAL